MLSESQTDIYFTYLLNKLCNLFSELYYYLKGS